MNDEEEQISKEFFEKAKIDFLDYKPYPKQKDFHASGINKRERALFAGNQVGKTLCCAYEVAFHLTGKYPEWWIGRRFDRPIVGWVAGVTSETTRDVIQRKLIGDKDSIGIIHPSYILDTNSARGVADLLDTVKIKHVNGTSILQFKSYEKGREKWQGTTLDFVWFDEEPPMDIYVEGISRTNATGGMVMMSFTPLLGMSEVVLRYWKESSPSRSYVLMGIKDANHISEEQKKLIIDTYPPHERQARVEGIPILGSGRVFPIMREQISRQVPQIPAWWQRLAGLDIGWDHPTAVVWLAYNPDADIIWVYDCYKLSQTDVMTHAGIVRSRGDWIPVAWPHDALQHDKASGQQIAEQYVKHGVNMLAERAQFSDGSNGVEAGIMMMYDRMKMGKFFVAPHLTEWFEEFELYHRENGKIIKEKDDLISATRYAIMMLRYAQQEPHIEEEEKNDYNFRHNRNPVTGY